MEKECSALGGLFQAIINDMKVKRNMIYSRFLSGSFKLFVCVYSLNTS